LQDASRGDLDAAQSTALLQEIPDASQSGRTHHDDGGTIRAHQRRARARDGAARHRATPQQLILAHSVDARKASGAVQVDALQRIDYPNHFALVEQWQSQSAWQAHASTQDVVKFRGALGPLQIAPYDERFHSPLSVGASLAASADSVVIITHVDIIPASVEAGTGKVISFAEQGRAAAGNRRFDALVQASRRNHMTIFEGWDSLAAKNSWISTPAARSFREEMQPMSGSLYDERAYRPLR
jgi:quinol monooxygenase YgiN